MITVNGREYKILENVDLAKYPNIAQTTEKLLHVKGKRGAMGSLYKRNNGTWWIAWISRGWSRTEEVQVKMIK